MKFNFYDKYQSESEPDIDIAPMVDVIFLLLIFFMVTSTFILQPGFKIDLPESVTSDNKTAEFLTVYIDGANNIFVNDKKTDIKELQNEIKKIIPKLNDLTMSLNADKSVEYGLVIRITDIAKYSGLKNVILTTQPVSSGN